MNLCSDHVTLLNKPDIALGQALADMATISLLQNRGATEQAVLADQLQSALNNRVIIEQAKGILAERAKVSPDEAFDLIRDHARVHNNRLLHDAKSIINRTLRLHPTTDRSAPHTI